MKETAKKFSEIVKEAEATLLKEFIISDEIRTANKSEMIFIGQLLELTNASLELNEKLAEKIDSIENKLDKILLK